MIRDIILVIKPDKPLAFHSGWLAKAFGWPRNPEKFNDSIRFEGNERDDWLEGWDTCDETPGNWWGVVLLEIMTLEYD